MVHASILALMQPSGVGVQDPVPRHHRRHTARTPTTPPPRRHLQQRFPAPEKMTNDDDTITVILSRRAYSPVLRQSDLLPTLTCRPAVQQTVESRSSGVPSRDIS